MTERTGGCQCGRVRYRVTGEPLKLAACHCRECQRHSGSAFGMSMIVREESLVVQGSLTYFERSSDSGRPLGNFFCPVCGTRIYTKPTFIPGIVNLKPGTLDDTSWLRPELHAWTGSRQHWFELPEGVPTFEKQP